MHDYYGERLSSPWYRHQSQLQSIVIPSYEDALQRQLFKACRSKKYDSDDDSDDENVVEKATRAHMQATSDWEKAKEKSEDAKKKVEECEAKMHAATRKLEKAKRETRRFMHHY
ncbi:hypothetical protein C7974DRAFT_413212 [Boeremia exigua]|uniref:uncharacterized protein n=1 Tax=Boeremia exigua TaxID=749465 RepID=UPI001E8D9EB1|nr:uncharacterized protein C7974DRAFT_413212 [Boeremia exigua]KAH6629413.1 hypothetical protein C7974DRAFT_413212 [Boeremia exigua]